MIRLFLCILFVTSLARADDMRPKARAKYQQGLSAFQAKRYTRAIASFKAAYALDARPEILFAWAQATRLSGDCEAAVPLYRKVLADTPSAKREPIQALIDKCQPPPPPATVPAATPPPRPERPPFYKDVPGDVLFGTGVVAAGTGVTLVVLSDTSGTQRTIGYVALSAGVGLATAGVLRWIFRSPPTPDAPAVTLFHGGGATIVGLSLRL